MTLSAGASKVLADQLMENGATHADTLKALNATLPGHVLLDPEQARAIRDLLVRTTQWSEERDTAYVDYGVFLRALIAARDAGLMVTP